MAEQHGDRLAKLEERYAGYEVYDRDGEKIGKVDDIFVDENDDVEYIGVETGLLRMGSTILIPTDAARVDEGRRVVEVSQPKNKVEEGPTFGDDKEITPEFEERVRSHYGLGSPRASAARDADEGRTLPERIDDSEGEPRMTVGGLDRERAELQERPDSTDHEGIAHEEAEPRFTGYQVYDRHYEKVGKVDDIFVDENDRPEYISMKMGFLGARSTLIPMDIVRVNDKRRLVEVEAEKDAIEEGPTFGDDREVTPEFERRVLNYYQVETARASRERRAYGPYYSDTSGDERVDVLPGERAGTHVPSGEREPGGLDLEQGNLTDEEVRLPRSEEGGTARASDSQASRVNVRKRVPANRQRPAAPEGGKEVRADRPPADSETPDAEMGDNTTKGSE